MENEAYIVKIEQLDFERPCGICETTIKVGDMEGDIRYPDGTGEHVCENCAAKYPLKLNNR